MELKEGIAGFFLAAERKSYPRVDFEKFRKEISASLSQLGYTLLYAKEAGVTPNFHLAVFESRDERFALICNSIYPVVALVDELDENIREIRCLVNEKVENAIQNRTGFQLLPPSQLTMELTPDDLEKLNDAEKKQAKYWKPKTIGEVVFNWWD